MRENSCNGKATGAFDIHEVRVWRLHKSLEFVLPLLGLSRGVKEIDGERHFEEGVKAGELES